MTIYGLISSGIGRVLNQNYLNKLRKNFLDPATPLG